MVTFKQVKELEGKIAVITTKNHSVYIGKFSNVLPVKEDDGRTVASVDFTYQRFYEFYSTEGPGKHLQEGHHEAFSIYKSDIVYDASGLDLEKLK